MDSETKKFEDKDRAIKTVIAIVLLGLVVSGTINGGWAIITILFALAQFLEANCFY